ncbi:hypothetical protein ACFQ1S_05790 [Kibdelosporangium lantanae]|uniref:Uncharacterized protein n=1 Tax=Kibdelosporangium lantanae TaxID=1497396 RepID=A0ABW3M378_9PSEU
MVDAQRPELVVVGQPVLVHDRAYDGEHEGQQDGSPPGQPTASADDGVFVPFDLGRGGVKIAVAIARGGHGSTR